jgi:guanine nucleotide-binding protein subunit alpha
MFHILYLFACIFQFAQPDFEGTENDHLHSRVRTTGIVNENFCVPRGSNNRFTVFDLGGQKSERKKWINCFDNVTAVIFVSALSGFDMSMFEDVDENRLLDDIKLFHSVVHEQAMVKVNMIVFLNKIDLFRKKLAEGKTIRTAFPDYEGKDDEESQIQFVKEQFLSQRPTGPDVGDTAIYVTQATDAKKLFVRIQHCAGYYYQARHGCTTAIDVFFGAAWLFFFFLL